MLYQAEATNIELARLLDTTRTELKEFQLRHETLERSREPSVSIDTVRLQQRHY